MKRLDLAPVLMAMVAIGGFVVSFGPYLTQHWALAPYFDTVYLTGPLFCDISRNVKAGASPLMNWSSFEALDYNPHVAAYYPFYLFGWLDFCSAKAAAQAADIIAVFHTAIFALTMASLIRATGASLLAAIVGAAIVTTLQNTYAIAIFPTFIAAVAWLPMAIEGLVRLYYRRDYALGALLLAAGTGAMLTAGPGTNLLSALVLVGIVMTLDTLCRLAWARDRSSAVRMACALLAAGIVTGALVLASTIHLFGHIDEIIRWTRSGSVVGRARIGVSEILTERLTWRQLPQLLVPIQTSYAAGCYLLGPAAFLLALLGAVTGWSKPAVRVFAILVMVCIVLVFLSPPSLLMVWAVTPGLSHTRHLSLVGTPLSIGVGVLCAYGFASLVTDMPGLRARALPIAVAGLAVLVVTIATLLSGVPLNSGYPIWGLSALAVVTTGLFAFLPWVMATPWRQCGAGALLILQFAFILGSAPRVDGTPTVTRNPTWISVEAALQHIQNTDPDPGRVALHTSITGGGELSYMDAGSVATYMGLPTFTHYTTPRIYWKFVQEIGLVTNSNFAPLGGKYLLSEVPLPSILGEQVFQTSDIRVYRLNGSRPMVATLCPAPGAMPPLGATTIPAPVGELPLLQGPIVDAISAAQDGQHDCTPPQAPAARIVRADNALTFTVAPGSDRLLVINVPPYASWRLRADGRTLPLYNLQERQVIAFVPPDVSGLATLTYAPTAFWWKYQVTKIAWAAVVLSLIWLVGRRLLARRAEQPVTAPPA